MGLPGDGCARDVRPGPSAAGSRRGRSLVFGLVLGLGMLTKPTFAACMSGALAWGAWRSIRAPDRGTRVVHLLGAPGVAVLIALPWYGPRLVGLPMQIINRSFKQAAEGGQVSDLTGTSLLFYPKWIVPQFGLLATVLLLWGIVALARQRPGLLPIRSRSASPTSPMAASACRRSW